jgi:hypothetical protein
LLFVFIEELHAFDRILNDGSIPDPSRALERSSEFSSLTGRLANGLAS